MYRVQAGGGSVHVWWAFHSGAKFPLVLSDRWAYGGILQNTIVPFARQHFGDNYRYQDDSILDLFQQGNGTKTEQPARLPGCNSTELIWDEFSRPITSMDNPPQNLGELRQAPLDKWVEIHEERLQRIVASMSWRLAITAARGGNTQYWPSIRKKHTNRQLRAKKSSVFDQIYLNYHLRKLRYAHAANFSNINECYHKCTKIHIKLNKIVHATHRKSCTLPTSLSLDLKNR